MGSLIDKYFVENLKIPHEEAVALHQKYYKSYGLAIDGLVRHHPDLDPLDFNSKVDDALPLEDFLKPDKATQDLLADLDTSKIKPWLFTNAYKNHARRVIRLIDVEKFFEGLTYCDYAAPNGRIVAKPTEEMCRKAMTEAGVTDVKDCYFVDDSYINVKGAAALGWSAVHILEISEPVPEVPASQYQVRSLQELRTLFPQFFKSTNGSS